MKHEKQRNNNPLCHSRIPPHLVAEVTKSNHAIIAHVGAFVGYYKRLYGLSDTKIGLRAGCSHVAIIHLRQGKLPHCGISFLSKVALSFGCNLLDWLRSPVPGEVEKRGEIEAAAGVFGK